MDQQRVDANVNALPESISKNPYVVELLVPFFHFLNSTLLGSFPIPG